MKKLIASMFGISLLALFALSVDSTSIAVDENGSLESTDLLSHCGKCDKDEDNDEHEHEDADEEEALV